MSTASDLISNALFEINYAAPGESISSADLNFCLNKLNRMLDQRNAQRLFTYNVTFVSSYVLTPNLSPHTIGPTGTFVVTQRPMEVKAAAIILNNITPNVTQPLTIRDDDWWANERVKSLATSLPTDLYYSPDFPNGSLFFWPVPNTAWGLELETRTVLAQLALTDTISLPPGYEEELTMSLAEALCAPLNRDAKVSAQVSSQAMRARAIIKGANSFSPRISTQDVGMPTKTVSTRSDFNYRTGRVGRG